MFLIFFQKISGRISIKTERIFSIFFKIKNKKARRIFVLPILPIGFEQKSFFYLVKKKISKVDFEK
jgi:hypothetical protein